MSERDRRRRKISHWDSAIVVGLMLLLAGCLWAASWMHLVSSNSGSRGDAPPPSSEYGTAREIGTHGDDPNPRALFHGAFPSDEQTQERRVGGLPARFSGYTTWLRSVTRVPARRYVDGYAGDYLRLHVTVFNRDRAAQHVCACDFYVWTRTAGKRDADVVKAATLSPDTTMGSGDRLDGRVFLYVGTVRGPYFVIYDPDSQVFGGGDASGVWRVPE